jgi:hypothetical protein
MFSAPRNERTKQFLQTILERNAELGEDSAAFPASPSA